MNIVIPMAGLASRFMVGQRHVVKPMIEIGGIPMIELVLETLNLPGKYIFVLRDDVIFDELEYLLRKKVSDCKIIKIAKLSRGPADTVLAASNEINNNDPLIIANSDQIMNWDSKKFLLYLDNNALDGVVVTFISSESHNSYAKLNKDGFVTCIKEKEVVSNHALNGIHFWRYGKYFVESAKAMIDSHITTNGEFYVGPTYNYLINKGLSIGIYPLLESEHFPVGTPIDLKKYEENFAKIQAK